MRGLLFLFLAFILAGCTVRGTPIVISTEMPDDTTQTPGMLVQTVIVTVIVTPCLLTFYQLPRSHLLRPTQHNRQNLRC